MAFLIAGLMVLTVFCISGSARISMPAASQQKETFTISVINTSAGPIENTHIYLAGGHVDPIVFVLDDEITDANGECQFSVEPGLYTLYVIGPDVNGSVLNLGQGLQSVYFPNLRFITVAEGANNDQSFTLIKRPKYWSVEAMATVQQQQSLLK